jgi:hypothetical protein
MVVMAVMESRLQSRVHQSLTLVAVAVVTEMPCLAEQVVLVAVALELSIRLQLTQLRIQAVVAVELTWELAVKAVQVLLLFVTQYKEKANGDSQRRRKINANIQLRSDYVGTYRCR